MIYKNKTKHRIFLVGCARSGTTLLQSLLAAHPDVISFPESHFFRHLTPHVAWRKYLGLANPSIRSHLEEFYNEVGREDGACVSPGPFTLRMTGYARAFIRTLDNKAAVQGVCCWLEKTPIHLHYISLIEHYVPGAQFIHLVRDGRDVVASMHEVTHRHPEVWEGARSIEECLGRWSEDIERTRHYAEKPGHHVVSYRDVATDSESSLQRLCSALDVGYADSMTEEYQIEAEAMTKSFEEWKDSNTKEIRYSGHNKFDQRFNQEQKEKIENAVGKYDLDALTTV